MGAGSASGNASTSSVTATTRILQVLGLHLLGFAVPDQALDVLGQRATVDADGPRRATRVSRHSADTLQTLSIELRKASCRPGELRSLGPAPTFDRR